MYRTLTLRFTVVWKGLFTPGKSIPSVYLFQPYVTISCQGSQQQKGSLRWLIRSDKQTLFVYVAYGAN